MKAWDYKVLKDDSDIIAFIFSNPHWFECCQQFFKSCIPFEQHALGVFREYYIGKEKVTG
jgi:hypothetical protein